MLCDNRLRCSPARFCWFFTHVVVPEPLQASARHALKNAAEFMFRGVRMSDLSRPYQELVVSWKRFVPMPV